MKSNKMLILLALVLAMWLSTDLKQGKLTFSLLRKLFFIVKALN